MRRQHHRRRNSGQFLVGERSFGNGDGRSFRRFKISSESFDDPFTLEAKFYETLKPIEFFGFTPNSVFPRGIKPVHVGDGELVDINVTAMVTKSAELVRKGLVFGESSRLDCPGLAACNECINRIRYCGSLGRGLLGCWGMCDGIPVACPFELTAYALAASHSHCPVFLRLNFRRRVPETTMGHSQRFQPFFRSSNSLDKWSSEWLPLQSRR